jgi:hypothetical protein
MGDIKVQSMTTAPTDGRWIDVLCRGEWWSVSYQDCTWLREDSAELKGDPTIEDAWAIEDHEGPGHIELHEAEAWIAQEEDLK